VGVCRFSSKGTDNGILSRTRVREVHFTYSSLLISFVMAGETECALSITHDEMSLFGIQGIVAGEAPDFSINQNHLLSVGQAE
jgi:pentatricopeptide repeat protein